MSLSVDPTLSIPYRAPRTLRFTAVVFLKLSNGTFSDKGDLVRLLCMFPKLRLLQLGVVEFKTQPQSPLEKTQPRVRPLTEIALTELETVDILVPHMFAPELMEALGYTADSHFIQLRARSGGGNKQRHLRSGIPGAEFGRPKQDVIEPLFDEISLSYRFPGNNSKKVQVNLPLNCLPQIYTLPFVVPGASAEFREFLAQPYQCLDGTSCGCTM